MTTSGYFLLLGNKDRTGDTDLENLPIELSITDNTTTFELDIADDGCANPIDALQEVLILDGSAPDPAHNLLVNPLMAPYNDSNWSNTGGSGLGITYAQAPSGGVVITYGNSFFVGGLEQTTQKGLAIAGQAYCFSAYLSAASLVNVQAELLIEFLDVAGSQISSHGTTPFTPTGSPTRYSITATAPVGTVYITAVLYSFFSSGTNSGTLTYTAAQLEPVWFPALQSYPTSDCNSSQAGCTIMPDGTTVRQTRVFAGYTIDATIDYDNGFDRTWHVGVRGASWLPETQFVNATFSQVTDASIISTLVATLFPGLLSTNNVLEGVLIDSRTYDDVPLSEVLSDLANTSGFLFFVDHYFDLHYGPVGASRASGGLSDTPDNVTTFAYQDWKPQPFDATQMGNRVTVHGAPFTQTVVQTFTASGSQKKFVLTNPAPKEVTSVTVNGSEQIKGVWGNNNTTFAGGYQALVDFPNHAVLFQNNLAGGATVVVTYTFDSQIRAQEMDMQSFDTYKFWIDRKVNDTTIATTAAATQRALQELANTAFPTITLSFSTYLPLTPGQTVQITNSKEGYSATPFLVQKTTIHLRGEGTIAYEVICGADIPEFTRHVRNLHRVTARSKALSGQPLSSLGLKVTETVRMGADSVGATPEPLYAVYGALRWGLFSWG